MLNGKKIFQSTLPRGERLLQEQNELLSKNCISIHAPARGATGNENGFLWFCRNFNPRSREGSDLRQIEFKCGLAYDFNPRSREGSDPYNL